MMEERTLALLYQLNNNTLMEMIVDMDDTIDTQKSQLRLLAGEVLKAHLIEEWDTMEDQIVERPCQCPACKVAREVMGEYTFELADAIASMSYDVANSEAALEYKMEAKDE